MSAVPKLRFQQTSGSDFPYWTKVRMKKLMSERNEQAPQSEDYPLMAFIAKKGVAPKGDRYNRNFLVKDEQGKKYKRTELGDFIYSSNNLEAGSIGMNSLGPASISPVYSIFKIHSNNNYKFMSELLSRPEFISKMVRFRQGVVYGQWRIHEKAFLGIEQDIPSQPEQQKIASFLSSVDKKIDLLRQKKDALELYKKGLMQKIFSQEIRFKQDDGSVFPDWEEVPFERLAERKSDRHKSGSADILKIIELENIQSSQGSLTGEIQEKIPSLNNHIFQANDVLFGKLRPYLKKWYFAKFSGACSSEIWVLRARQGVDSEFLYYLVQSELFLTLTQMSSGSKMPRADWKVIADSDFQLPSLAEQVKVSRLLAGIDQKISKLAAFSDHMETFKKGLLQQMFV